MRARLIGRPQGRAEAVRQLGQIAVGDEGVAQRLLLLFGERQQGGLPDDARLDPAGDGVVRGQGRLAGRAAQKGGDRREAAQDGHVGRRLRVDRGGAQHEGHKADPAPYSFHAAAPSRFRLGPLLSA